MYLAILLAYVVLIVAIAIRGKLRFKTLLSVSVTEEKRVKRTLGNIVFGCVALLVLFVVCLLLGISFADIGLRPISFDYNIWFTVITLVLCGAILAQFIYQTVSPKHKKTVADLDNSSKSGYGKVMELLLPRTKKEKMFATVDSVTVGIYEEILARGFLLYVLQMQFPNLSIILVVLITSLLFGVGHFYQGLQGIIMTTVAGILLGFLFVVTGSLIPSILLHFFVNFSDVFTVRQENTA
ncbi:MAG: CPBP family intramembrane metalloprotease [Defluviitaleaceae bacterium]|nr:CPBP family intramembrane metalloprotease [Defluviitaleaceae bacterium]